MTDTWRTAALAVALAVVVAGAHSPALSNGFVNWDDDRLLINNPVVVGTGGLRRIWTTLALPGNFPNYPLLSTLYWIEFRLWALNPAGYHTVNVLLHAANTALVLLLALALGSRFTVAGLTAALFGLHPIQVESVAWVAEQKNVLSAFFGLGTALFYLCHRASGRWHWYSLSLLAFGCALLSKTAAAVLPLSLALLDRFRMARWSAGTLWRIAPMVALAVTAGALTLAAESRPESVALAARPLLAATCLWFYVLKLLVPWQLLPVYPRWELTAFDLRWWVPLIAAGGAAGALWRWVRDWRVHWGVAHFACTLLPVLGLVSYGFNEYSFVADRHVYLASIGLFLVAAMGLDRLRAAGRAPVVLLFIATLLLALGRLTYRQAHVWRDSVSLWTHALAGNRDAWVAHSNLGLALIERGDLEEATRHLRTAIEQRPDAAEAHTNLALALYRQGDFAGAEQHSRQAVAAVPMSSVYRKNLALALEAQGRLAEAEAELIEVLKLEPRVAAFHYLLGNVLLKQRRDGAIAAFERALQLEPDMLDARTQLGRALLAAGRAPEAVAAFEKVVHKRPDVAEARYNLALALQRSGRHDDAAQEIEAALKLRPDFRAASELLAAIRGEQMP